MMKLVMRMTIATRKRRMVTLMRIMTIMMLVMTTLMLPLKRRRKSSLVLFLPHYLPSTVSGGRHH